MEPMTKVLLLYLASSLFLCSFSAFGQATNELFEEDPSVLLRSHNGDQIRNELAMIVNENINWDRVNVSTWTKGVPLKGKMCRAYSLHSYHPVPAENVWRTADASL